MADKRLRISLLGKDGIKVWANVNKNKQKDTDPDYRGDGVAVWVSDAPPDKPKEENVVRAAEV